LSSKLRIRIGEVEIDYEGTEDCLKLRNGCGHPNSLKIGANKVAAHLETLWPSTSMQFTGRPPNPRLQRTALRAAVEPPSR
jgi:hypothetical protein